MLIKELTKAGVCHPPKFLLDNVHYLVTMGSEAYGVSSNSSDIDLYGFCIPPKNVIFPHVTGHIRGFGPAPENFEQWFEHHIMYNGKEYDVTVFNIVKYMNLCAENNPNVLDSLFVPDRCVRHITKVGMHLRENRKKFLHKGAYKKFKGYAQGQKSRIINKKSTSNEKRSDLIEQHGYDTKFAYHVVRLALEAEEILMNHNLTVDGHREVLKAVRRGDWKLETFDDWFDKKFNALETLYITSTLPDGPDWPVVTKILYECLEIHYGSLDKLVNTREDGASEKLLKQISNLLKDNGY